MGTDVCYSAWLFGLAGRDNDHAWAYNAVVQHETYAVLDHHGSGCMRVARLLRYGLMDIGIKRHSHACDLLAMVLAQHVDKLLLN